MILCWWCAWQGYGLPRCLSGRRHRRRPWKDTAGPSINVLIKLMATITLVMASCSLTSRDARVAVIGGWGITGLTDALRLAQHGS